MVIDRPFVSSPAFTASLLIHHMNDNSNVFTFGKQHLTQDMFLFNLFTHYEAVQLSVEYLNSTLRDSAVSAMLSTLFKSYQMKCCS